MSGARIHVSPYGGPVTDDVYDEALERLAGRAPEWGPAGLANHGPMAADALVHLGHPAAVPGFIDRYLPHLDEGPGPGEALKEDDWEKALGSIDRFADWVALFDQALADRPYGDVAGEWLPRLAPGSIAAALHGMIRSAHAVRALGEADNPLRRHELAEGLAYWAARYQELPGPPVLIGTAGIEQTLAGLPHLPSDVSEEFLITDQVRHIEVIADQFESAVVALAPPPHLEDALVDLAVGGASAYLLNAERGHAIALVHAVTGPMALELLLPVLRPDDQATAFAYAWQAVASLHVAYGVDRGTIEVAELPYPEELAANAVRSGDEHAIKMAEAALRAYKTAGDSSLLAAAADAAVRLAG
jgi:hypothetical protein